MALGHHDEPKQPLCRESGRESDGVVEGQAQRLVDVLSALAAVEQVLLDVVADGEESAASCIRRGVDTVGTSDTAGQSTYNNDPVSVVWVKERRCGDGPFTT